MFRLKECSVRRRYSDFEWLRKELERDSKVRRDELFFAVRAEVSLRSTSDRRATTAEQGVEQTGSGLPSPGRRHF